MIRQFALGVLLLNLSTFALPAHAEGASAVTGQVRDRTSQAALVGVTVVVGRIVSAPPFGLRFEADASSTTQSDGTYAISGFTPAPSTRYVVIAGGGAFEQVLHPNVLCRFGCVFSGGTPSMFLPASGVDFLTTPAGFIRGRVTRSDTGAPITLEVSLRRASNVQDSGFAQPDADGRFLVEGLPADDYWVDVGLRNASSELTAQLFPGIDLDITRTVLSVAASGLHAPLRVSAGSTSVADFSLNRGGCLSGTRVSAIDGSPVRARVFLKRTDALSHANFVEGSTPSSERDFRIDRLIPGSVKASFGYDQRFQPNFFPDAQTEALAQPITLGPGPCTPDIDAHLVPRQVVRGFVRDAVSGVGVPGVEVVFGYYFSGIWPGLVQLNQAMTNAAGEYVLQGFDADTNRLVWTRDMEAYFGQAYFMHPPLTPVASWTRFTVVPDQAMTGMDFALQRGAFVSGTVTGRIEANYDTTVQVLNEAGETVASARPPGVQGAYATNPFPPATYRLSVKPGLSSHRYAYPGVSCRGTGPGTGIPLCAVPGAELISFSALGEHQNYHFDVDAMDTFFRGGFE